MPVGELLARISSAELTEWAAYERIAGPIGPDRLDALTALQTAVIANGSRGKNQRPFTPSDFMPQWGGKPRQTWQQMLAAVKTMHVRLGGKPRKEGGGRDGS
ncbi:hypothetical protein ACFVU3_08125 [Streptomyces sp. NPDC058052]|uniref:phage tail assembly protein T n=1 Tax=Streptomyces sp. NPDC058052 TaxID=3346316 RepID=UPI0036ED607E